MTEVELTAGYERLAGTVARMLELARSRQWVQLPDVDALCTDLVAQLEDAQPRDLSEAGHRHLEAINARIERDRGALNAVVRPQLLHLVQRMYEMHGGR
jgi:flagellar protein FliT